MDIGTLIEALSAPAAYPYPAQVVEVRQTHISAVFLAGPFAYKVKKPVNPGFLDFSTLEKRRHFCQEEVRLNRRLAAEVYLGVVPVVRAGAGVRLEGEGDVVDWVVKMQRLPDKATLHERLERGAVAIERIEALAHRIACFHRDAERNERIAAFGRFEAVARLILDLFSQAAGQVGITVSDAVFGRIRALVEESLSRLRSLIADRASRGVPRDCHGDLHLDHIYYFPDREPPADLIIIDCIEFNERFRFIDPVADMAFPAMDLAFHGRRDLARAFADAYFLARADPEGRALLPLYTAYRAAVRGMVEGLELAEKEVSECERAVALRRARGHWLLALTELEDPCRKPCLVLVAGLPGSGKSHLAGRLAENAGFAVVRSDVVRKDLAGIPSQEQTVSALRPDLYSPEWNERTYAECLRRSERLLFEGQRVLVDATFRDEQKRRSFLQAALHWGVPSVILLCQAGPETVRKRLQSRRGDVFDADWSVYLQLAAEWQAMVQPANQLVQVVSTEGSPEQADAQALAALRQCGLYG